MAVFEIFYEDFVDMSHEDTSFHMLENSVWLQLINFNYNCILVCEISFFDRWGHSKVTISECIAQISIMEKSAYCINQSDCLTIDESNHIKIHREIKLFF